MAENTQMLALGKKLGFTMEKVPGEAIYSLRIDLDLVGSESQSPDSRTLEDGR